MVNENNFKVMIALVCIANSQIFAMNYPEIYQKSEPLLCKYVRQFALFPLIIPDVDMDHYLVVRGENPAIGTKGVATCIAVAGVGKVHNEFVLALGHASVLVPPECALLKITHELRKQGCPYTTIKISLIGGNSHPGSVDTQQEFLELAKSFNICCHQFNPLNVRITK